MQRDAHLIYVMNTTDLLRVLASPKIVSTIAGFVVADAAIMDGESESESGDAQVLGEVVVGLLCRLNPSSSEEQEQEHELGSGRMDSRWKQGRRREWTILFAFDFPAQAARHPLRFGKFIRDHFGVGWKICGSTKGRVRLEIGERALSQLGVRVYRGNKYEIRGVFLEGVDEGDKVLVVAKGASVKNGGLGSQGQTEFEFGDEGEEGGGGSCGEDGGETDSTAGGDREFEIERVEEGGAVEGWTAAPLGGLTAAAGGGNEDNDIDMVDPELCREEYDWADDELTTTETETEDADEDENASESTTSSDADERPNQRVIYINAQERRQHHQANAHSDSEIQTPTQPNPTPQEKPKRIADCPVAIHEVNSWIGQGGQRIRRRGFVGFVGHVEDNRSMASLILGMCAVRNTRPLPESMQEYLRTHNLA
ncbi:hypothetical protein BDW59DRAFT_151881 [Aspergillus cavernicola]|uniref:Uncharacterized protein n=1 Tax=Aspergillus cavernicola TaxID=176166 RepID=A0ABR4HTK4_9EURO